jgi:hypothetical protein
VYRNHQEPNAMRLIFVFLLLASLAACAGEPLPPTDSVEIAQNGLPATETPPATIESEASAPTTASRFSTVSPERLTELPSLRDLANIPTFTPTNTPTITPSPTPTHTPSPTLTPTPLSPEDYCELMGATTTTSPGTVYHDEPVLLRLYMPIPEASILFSLRHAENEAFDTTVTVPGGQVASGTFQPEDWPISGRYDWTATALNPDGEEMCSRSGYFIIERPESTAEAEATAEVTLEVTVEIEATSEVTPEVTAEVTEEATENVE